MSLCSKGSGAIEISSKSNGLFFSNVLNSSFNSTASSTTTQRHYSSLVTDVNSRALCPAKSGESNKSKISFSSSASKRAVDNNEVLPSGKIQKNKLHHDDYHTSLKLESLPVEILDSIFSYIGQRFLTKILTLSKTLFNVIYNAIYARPHFTTTYRFAQFVSAISKTPSKGKSVYSLDMTKLQAGILDNDGLVLAGWRDWKLRSEPLYNTSRYTRELLSIRGNRNNVNNYYHGYNNSRDFLWMSSRIENTPGDYGSHPICQEISENHDGDPHPIQSPLLRQFSQCKDIPMGYIIHTLSNCINITLLDLSHLPLADDYYIIKQMKKTVFVSDVSRSNTWKDDEVKRVTTNDVIDCLIKLENLSALRLRRVTWITQKILTRFLTESYSVCNNRLEELDLRGAGMVREAPWAVKGTPKELKKRVIGMGQSM